MKKRWFFVLAKLINRNFIGLFQSQRKGSGGIEFATLREYQPADPVSLISYAQSLKRCRYFVRENIVEKGGVFLFIVDGSASVDFGPSGVSKREIQNRLLNILAPAIVQNNNQVGFLVVSDCVERYFKPAFGGKSVAERLSLIFLCGMKSKLTDLNSAFRFVLRLNILPDAVFVLSDFYTPVPFVDSLKALSQRCDVIPLLLKDPFETSAFPNIKGGMFHFRDMETGEFFWGDKPQKISNKRLFKRLGLDYVLLRTDKDESEWIKNMMIVFAQRKRRRRRLN